MAEVREMLDRILGPRDFSSAVTAIKRWDANAGTMPLLSESIARMPEGPKSWSITHSWPSVLNAMVSVGLVRELEAEYLNGSKIPMTEITDLGREVRDHFSKTA